MAFTLNSGARHSLHPPSRAGPLTTPQASRHATDRIVAPPYRAFDAGLRPGPFPDRAASLLPGLLAATRTGLPPAGDDELTNTKKHHGTTSRCHLPFCWAHEKTGLRNPQDRSLAPCICVPRSLNCPPQGFVRQADICSAACSFEHGFRDLKSELLLRPSSTGSLGSQPSTPPERIQATGRRGHATLPGHKRMTGSSSHEWNGMERLIDSEHVGGRR
jgi:hypothetical protein